MSEWHYRDKVARGIISSQKECCYPTAWQRIVKSPLPDEIFPAWERFVSRYNRLDVMGRHEHMPEFEKLFNKIASSVGNLSVEDAVFYRPTTKSGFVRKVSNLLHAGFKAVVDVDYNGTGHSLGVIMAERRNTVLLRSNFTPRELWGEVNLGDLYDHLTKPCDDAWPDGYYPAHQPAYTDANVAALPPV